MPGDNIWDVDRKSALLGALCPTGDRLGHIMVQAITEAKNIAIVLGFCGDVRNSGTHQDNSG